MFVSNDKTKGELLEIFISDLSIVDQKKRGSPSILPPQCEPVVDVVKDKGHIPTTISWGEHHSIFRMIRSHVPVVRL